MSLQGLLHPVDVLAQPSPSVKEVKQPMRSWRKKFRKLRLRFDKAMEESNRLFMDEHKDMARARRLQEENDQYLEILLQLNEQTHTANRYTLAIPGDREIGLNTFRQYTTPAPGLRPLDKMIDSVPHTRLSNGVLLEDVAGEKPPGYMDGSYEEEYLANLDAQLEDHALDDDLPILIRPAVSRNLPGEKDLSNQNPNSVVSWLRRHHPETFLQEHEKEVNKAPPKARGTGKRASIAQAQAATPLAKVEPDFDDEYEFAMAEPVKPAVASGRGKKTKDDEAYRPKGGGSRSNKRKRITDGDAVETGGGGMGKKGKRAKASIGTPS